MTQTIWLHGAGQHGGTWQPRPEGACPDLPGHRAAPRVPHPSVRCYANVIIADLPDQFQLIGHSLGAMVAMDIAARYPARCTALLLIDPPLRMPLWLLRRFGPAFAALASYLPGPKGIAALMALRVERVEGRPIVRDAIAAMSRGGLRDAMIAATRFDGMPLISQLTMPTLAILGQRSLLTGASTAKALRTSLPQGTVEVWDTGHMIPFDAPDALNSRVQAFLSAGQ